MKIDFSKSVLKILGFDKEFRRRAETLVECYKMDKNNDSGEIYYNDHENNDYKRIFVLCIDPREDGIRLW